jgi:shikimate dehydrogenase
MDQEEHRAGGDRHHPYFHPSHSHFRDHRETEKGMKRFGIIGYPLAHSLSKKYFTEKFEKLGLKDHVYAIFPMENISAFPGLVRDTPGLAGLSVTIPHKETVIPFLNELDETARGIGAVNCIHITGNNLKGYNTDAFGFRQAIKPFWEPRHERALILGTGGSSKAIAYVLKQLGVPFYFVTRNKAENGPNNVFTYNELDRNIISAFNFIINCTPVGMSPNADTCPPIPYGFVTPDHFCFDLVYNPAETLFLKKAKEKGALTQNGLTMLHQQAEKAWEIWNRTAEQ